MDIRVFVYGTLKQGQRNHHYLAGAKFAGPHLTDKCFDMYLFDDYPAVTENGSVAINGEIYYIDRQQFQRLDELEWYPRFYQRIEIDTAQGMAWMYVVKAEMCRGKQRLAGCWPSVAT